MPTKTAVAAGVTGPSSGGILDLRGGLGPWGMGWMAREKSAGETSQISPGNIGGYRCFMGIFLGEFFWEH